MLVRHILSRVYLRWSQLVQLYFSQYMGLCIFSLPITLEMILILCVFYLIIIIKREIWSQLPQLYFVQFMGLCAYSLSISLAMISRIYVLYLIFLIKWEIWNIVYNSRLHHETSVCADCLIMFILSQILGCRLFNTKRLSEPILDHC